MILSAGCIVTILFPSVVTGPGYILTYPGGDGGKNVLAYLYHILYDKGFWFSGMNYPYGENIIYTDGQPLLSITLSYFKPTMVHALQIMGWSIVLSYFLAIIYVNKILWHFGVKPLIAIVFSGLIII
ncbi:MAG: hypothetical protein JWQ38_2636, partial [Flavipsychrobacter sp.]|nr:hypothetical protein [Flavipsychrobacter sp.]